MDGRGLMTAAISSLISKIAIYVCFATDYLSHSIRKKIDSLFCIEIRDCVRSFVFVR